MTVRPRLDSFRFDELAGLPDELWTAKAIADVLGVSVETVYRLADKPQVPIYKPGGRYFASRRELLAWRKSK